MRRSVQIACAAAGAAAVLVTANLLLSKKARHGGDRGAGGEVPESSVSRLAKPGTSRVDPKTTGKPDPARVPATERVDAVTSGAEDAGSSNTELAVTDSAPEPIHVYNGKDPNAQPRDTFHMTMAGAKSLPTGYEVVGDFELGEGGWTLKPRAGGEEAKPRIGMVESPAIPMKFQSNAVNPLWKETSPDGSEVLVEVSLSEDGEKWTDWMPTTSMHYEGEMSPTYPDGRPNPNYGYTLGDMTFYGLKRFKFFRFAMTLYSEDERSPVVSDFRLFYQDSTMGDTEVANAASAEQPKEQGVP